MKTNITLFIVAFLFISACSKNKLPRPTEKGKNTFGCRIDGKVFTPCKSSGLFTTEPLSGGVATSPTIYAGVGAHCYEVSPTRSVSVSIDNFRGVGEYQISGYDVRGVYKEDYTVFDSNPSGGGKIIITKDYRQNKILSGTFEF